MALDSIAKARDAAESVANCLIENYSMDGLLVVPPKDPFLVEMLTQVIESMMQDAVLDDRRSWKDIAEDLGIDDLLGPERPADDGEATVDQRVLPLAQEG